FGGESGKGDYFGYPGLPVSNAVQACHEGERLTYVHIVVKRIVFGQVADMAACREAVLLDVYAVYGDLPRGGVKAAGKDFHGGGLPSTVGAEESQYTSGLCFERKAFQGGVLAIAFMELGYSDRHCRII